MWYSNTETMQASVEAYFRNKEITLDLLADISTNWKRAKKDLEKAREKTSGLHAPKAARVRHARCAEEVEKYEMMLHYCGQKLFTA